MSGNSWRLMRVAGIDIKIDSSWLIIAALVSLSLFFGLSAVYPNVGTIATAAISILGAILFFGSVLVHELIHAVVARRRGFAVKDITLYLFGGATQANVHSKEAGRRIRSQRRRTDHELGSGGRFLDRPRCGAHG